MARTVNTPINIPGECKGGGQIIGNDGGTRLSWQELAEAVNSVLNHKAPVLVCDTHPLADQWMGKSYPIGTSYKHRYKFPTPYRGLNQITYRASVYLRGWRVTTFVGGTTSWEVDYSVNGGTAVTTQVNGGVNGYDFVWKLADLALDHTLDFTTFDIWLKTYGAAMDPASAIYCLEVKWYADFSALPLGLYNLSDYPAPIFALDSEVLAGADRPLSSVLIQTMAAILEFCYSRAMPVFISSAIPYLGSDSLMENATSTFMVFAQVRVILPAGCPGVQAWVYMINAKFGGWGNLRLSGGGDSITTATNSTFSLGWNPDPGEPPLILDCASGSVITLEATNCEIGTIMIFARPSVLE